MFFLDNSYVFYIIVFLLISLAFLYVWRKLNGMEGYTKILERKNNNLKIDNIELRKLLKEFEGNQNSTDEADLAMNIIFDQQIGGSNVSLNKAGENSGSNVVLSTVCTEEKCFVKEIVSEPLVHNIISDAFDEKHLDLPTTVHNVVEQDIEIESVVSDNSGIMNRKKLSKMNLDKLKDICDSMSLSTDGTKNALIERILS